MRKKITIAFLIISFLALASIAALLISERTYISHLLYWRKHTDIPIDWYTPVETVHGANAVRELVKASPAHTVLPANTVQDAIAYAAKANSSTLLILHRGKLVADYFAPGRTITNWSDSASMMKTVTALLIGIAIDEKRIPSVDEPAATYLPAWARDSRREIRLRHLLQMHSGLRPHGKYEDPFSDACYLALGTDARHVVDHIPAQTPPGRTFDYNNVNFEALGFVLEAATGKRFAQYLSEKLWQPLGNREAALWLDHPKGAARMFGFLLGSPDNWARVGQLILNEGSVDGRPLVPASWIKFMCTPSPANPAYGAGLYTAADNDRGDPAFSDPGTVAINGRFKQRVYVIPARELVIVRTGPNVRGWIDAYLPNLFASKPR